MSAESKSGARSGLTARIRALWEAARPNLTVRGLPATGLRRGEDPGVDRLGGLLPFAAWTEDGLVVTEGAQPGSIEGIAFAVELSPQTGVTDEMQESLKILPTLLPVGTVCTMSVYASPVIDDLIEDWAAARSAAGESDAARLLAEATRARKALLKAAAGRDILPNAPVHARNFRVWFTAVVPEKDPGRGKAFDDVRAMRDAVRAVFRQNALDGWSWRPEDWLGAWRMLLNPQMLLTGDLNVLGPRDPNPWTPPREQIMNPETMVTIMLGGIRFRTTPCGAAGENSDCGTDASSSTEDVVAVGLSALHYPKTLDLAAFSRVLGDPGRSGAQIPCPFVLSTIFQIADPATEKVMIDAHKLRTAQMASTPIGMMVPYYRDFHQHLVVASNSFATEGGVGPVMHQLVLFSPARTLTASLQGARAVGRKAGFDWRADQAMHAQALLAVLPGAAGPCWAADARAMKRFPRRTIATALHGLPLMTEWRGTGPRRAGEAAQPLLMLLGRKGQVFGVDPFANPEGSYSMTVVGKPGSGKSVVLNELAAGVWSCGGLVRIIDVGRSYEKLANVLGGDFVAFSPSDVWDLNPFNLIADAAAAVEAEKSAEWFERLAMVVRIFAEFMSTSALEPFEESILTQAVTTVAYRAASERRVGTIPELRAELLAFRLQGREDRRAGELAAMLEPYMPSGPYAAWFDGHGRPLRFANRFTVLEMEGLEGQPKLRAGALMSLILTIEREMAARPRNETKLVLIDEAWDLMRSGHAGSFIETGYRRARKHGGSFVTATQSIADYARSETAEAAWRCADTRIFLRQDADAVDAMIAAGHFSPTPWLRDAITSVTTIAGAWSEMVVQVGGQPPAVGRLLLDPISRITYSTLPSEFEAVKSRVDAGMSWAGAILEVARA